MPHYRPRVGAKRAPSTIFLAATLVVVFGLAFLLVQSGAIEALNTSGLFGS